jgi:hypothetical protein
VYALRAEVGLALAVADASQVGLTKKSTVNCVVGRAVEAAEDVRRVVRELRAGQHGVVVQMFAPVSASPASFGVTPVEKPMSMPRRAVGVNAVAGDGDGSGFALLTSTPVCC